MNKQEGYIYIRYHESYDKDNACKLGKAKNIVERDSVYATSEIKRGKFILVIKVKKVDVIEKLLQNHFNNLGLHIYHNGGTEFYDKTIINKVVPYLKYLGAKYKELTQDEIDKLIRSKRTKKINIKKLIDYVKTNIMPNNQQIMVLNKINDFYKINTKGKLIWSCGLGKTLLSILISKKLNCKNVLIGVPSIYLQKQFITEIIKIFPNKKNLLCVGGDTMYSTTNNDKIISFLQKNTPDAKFTITTYASCCLLVNNKIKFDFTIGDEAHHLTGIENVETKGYLNFHKITTNKILFMTATEKEIDSKTNKTIYTMSDEKTFGKLIDEKSVNWAIENKKITDYNLLILSNTEKEINDITNELKIDVKNKELFMSAFMSLKSFEKYKDISHILICCNTTDNSDKISEYIDKILNKNIIKIDKKDFYNNSLHSNKKINIDLEDKNNEIEKFKQSKYGIISSVYIFGEGFDLPKLNGVVFAENMISDIRIVQTALRPNRLEKNNPNKKSYIIIPYMESDDVEKDNASFNRVRMIIGKIRNVDETVKHKIIVSGIKDCNNEDVKKIENKYTIHLNENIKGLDKIMMRLIYSKAIGSKLSEEQNEYNYVKQLNKELKIQSPYEYTKNELLHKHYIKNPDDYFRLNGVWDTWYDFLGVDITKFIQLKEKWIEFCKEKKVTSSDEYDKLCDDHDFLPKSPVYFYKDFTNIKNELGVYNRRRR